MDAGDWVAWVTERAARFRRMSRMKMKRFAVAALLVTLPYTTLGAGTTTIHPGDQLNVQVFGQPTLSQNVTVLPDGSITYPLIGRIQLGGETVDVATANFTGRLAKYVRHPYVTLAITTLGQPAVLVLGNVKTPGKYALRSDARVTDAIAAAGGVANVNGDLPDARVSDASGNVSNVALQKLLHDGDIALDRPVADGDVVYVPGPTMMDVVVTGAVDHPGDVQVAEGDRLSMAIARAGNSANANADLNHVRIERTMPDGTHATLNVNLYQALEKGDMTADVALQKGDVVFVPQAKAKSNWMNSPLLYLFSRLIPVP